jgi:hypothetical protein
MKKEFSDIADKMIWPRDSATKQPPFVVSLCQNSDSGLPRMPVEDLNQSSQAKGERKGPCSTAGRESRVRNAPFTLSMGRCSCPLQKRERGSSLLVQGKERGPCRERNLLSYGKRNPHRVCWAHRKGK